MLMEKGDDVLFATTIRYDDILKFNGIPSVGILNQANDNPFLFPGTWYCDPHLNNTVNTLGQIVDSYKPDAIISNPLGIAAMIIAEKYSIPFVNVGFSEYLYPGIGEVNKTKQWRINEISSHYNANRSKLFLPPIAVSEKDSPLIGEAYFIRNIPELDDVRELPSQVSYAGGLYWEPHYQSPRLNRFINWAKSEHRPVVYVQIGRLFGEAPFWKSLLNVFQDLPYAFIADLGRADYLHQNDVLPKNVFGSPFIPIGAIQEDIEFVICSAQSTSLISAIIHGKPILSIPHSADAYEFTSKIKEKNIGLGIVDKELIDKSYLLHCFNEIKKPVYKESVHHYQNIFLEFDEKSHVLEKISSIFQYSFT